MYTDLQHLSSSPIENYGGMAYFDFVPREWVSVPFYPDERTGIIDTAISLASGKSWLRAKCLVHTMEYEEKQKELLGQSYYEGVLSGVVLRDNITKVNLTNTMRFHEYVVVYYDRNNIGRVIGTAQAGMRFKADFSTGIHAKDNTRYGFTLSIVLEHRAPLYLVAGSGGGSSGGGDPDNPSS